MSNLESMCPVHDEELRKEWHNNGPTGFCFKCAKHYQLCTNVRYMSMCIKLKDHDGLCLTNQGIEFDKDNYR